MRARRGARRARRRGSATSSSTSRRSATRRPSTPTSRSTCRRCPWPDAGGVDRRALRGERRWSPSASDGRRAGRCGWSARGCTSTATGARSARSPPTCARWPRRAAGGVDADAARRRARRGCSPARPTARQALAAAAAVLRRLRGRRRRARAPARRRRSRGSSRCSPSRRRPPARRRRSSRSPRRPARPRRGSRRPCTTRRASSTSATPVARAAAGAAGVDAAPAARLAARAATAASATTAANRLPHDVVIVDETSMVSLSLMARLVEAVRPDARLILVGDPGQLASIEAGAVLGDIVGPAARRAADAARRARRARGGHRRAGRRDDPPETSGDRRRDRRARPRPPLRRRDRRARRGDPRAATPTRALAVLARGAGRASRGCPIDRRRGRRPRAGPRAAPSPPGARWSTPRAPATPRRRSPRSAAFRLLCAHRRGPYGVASWMRARSRAGSPRSSPGFGAASAWYVGPPAARDRERLRAAALQRRHRRGRRGRRRTALARGVRAPRRGRSSSAPRGSSAVETVYAMTIHKSQGSQFDTAAVLLPAADVARSSPASCSTRRSRARASG